MTTRTVTLDLTTAAVVEDSFPVAVPSGLTQVVGVRLKQARNVTDPAALFYSAVGVQWQAAGPNVRVDYISGLDAATRYQFDLEVSDA